MAKSKKPTDQLSLSLDQAARQKDTTQQKNSPERHIVRLEDVRNRQAREFLMQQLSKSGLT